MSIRMAIMTVASVSALAGPAFAAQDITKRATVAADATIDVSNVQGRVDVTAWDRNEVELTARLESDKDELTFEATERQVRIEVERPDNRKYRGEDDAILTIKAPKNVRLLVDTVSADITVNGTRGEQRLESVSGTIRTQAFDQRVSLHSVSGDLILAGAGGKAPVSTENVSGTTRVTGVRGSYDGEAVSGDIHAAIAAADRVRTDSVSGDVDIQAELTAAASVEMESISGAVALTMKPPVNAQFDIESFSGDIENCFGQAARDTSKFSPGSELSFRQGSGSARVEIQTLSGDIRICDR